MRSFKNVVLNALNVLSLCLITGCATQFIELPSHTLSSDEHVMILAPTTSSMAPMAIMPVTAVTPDEMPRSNLTPGAIFVGADVSVICVSGYTARVRNVPDSERKEIFATYGIDYSKHDEYELDHLISLELGGSNDKSNLWPQPHAGAWNSFVKDQLENKMHALICHGQLSLAQAQKEIASDWVAAYKKYMNN